MIYSLRTKLAISHVLPILLLMPLLSLYLLYSLENFFTASLLQQLNYQARLLNDRVERDPQVLTSSQAAQLFLAEIATFTDARVLLLTNDATILGSTDPQDAAFIGTRMEYPYLAQVVAGERAQGVGPGLSSEVAYVVLPVRVGDAVVGLVRVSYEVANLRAQVNQLRLLILGGIVITALLGLGLALGLATTITRPLRNLSQRVLQIGQGNYHVRAPVQGRDEIASLASSFNQMAERLEELEQARQRQLAAITHELARPLTGMRATVETLREGVDADLEARELLLDGVMDELARMQRLTESLQQAQKRTLRPIELQREWVSLDRVVRGTLTNYEPLAQQAQITLTTELPAALPDIYADQDRLIQVFTNLLDNAFKFTPSGGQVIVAASMQAETVLIRVTDTGVGIAAEELPNLFQEFYQGGNAHPPEMRGMGLGLKICKEIVQAHGGTIQVTSQVGHSTRVTLTLPRGTP